MTALGFFILASAVAIDLPETAYFWYNFGLENPELFIRLTAPILMVIGTLLFTFGLKYHFQESKEDQLTRISSDMNVI